MRLTGYYWVKFDGTTVLGFYDYAIKSWLLMGYGGVYLDSDLTEVLDEFMTEGHLRGVTDRIKESHELMLLSEKAFDRLKNRNLFERIFNL